ncbi:short-chain dehydrogenase [Microbacterium mangrovi]|uniref:Short-chain dehydrogenase n=1 Tax=Microbacterium mangrovi TaxID=1348253 RepID=A0A0B2AB21_9MICO|nr:SDR family oxidoreductase [Microbacterium mangrovi]KHK98796.1 short-chain dehydrogenase [Microbacterium mangrovi]
MKDELSGLTGVVTGGSSGIGLATVLRLRALGAQAAVIDRSVDGTVEGFQADVTDSESVDAAVEAIVARFGGIDILVNNAGVGAQGAIDANDDTEWHHVWDVNVVGLARTTRACLPHLKASPAASVVNMASVAATVGLQQRALYSATKGAVAALTRAMAADFLDDGIRVNAVAPGTTATPWIGRLTAASGDADVALRALEQRQPHGRLVAPEEVAEAVAYLASPRSLSTNGQVIAVDGGLTAFKIVGR